MPKKTRAASLDNIFVSEAHRLIYTEISYLKRRIHLVEGERKANYESNEESLKKNEVQLRALKASNGELKEERKGLLECREVFTRELFLKLGDKRGIEFKDKRFEDVLDNLECKIGTLRNKQNLLKYNKEQQGLLMRDVVEEEGILKKVVEGKQQQQQQNNRKGTRKGSNNKVPSSIQKRLEDIKSTETSTAAMMMKISEADNIRSRYKNMLSLLKSENFTFNVKALEFSKKLDNERSEIGRMKGVLHESIKARKAARVRLSEVEETTIKDYTERQQALYETRLGLKGIREQMEVIGSKLSFPKFHIIHRDSSVADGGGGGVGGASSLYVGYAPLDDGQDRMGGGNVVQATYAELATLTGESDPATIVLRFQGQRDHSKELLVQEDSVKSAVRKAKLRKRFLLDKLKQLQFSGGLKRENLNLTFGEVRGQLESTTVERDRLNQWLQNHNWAMEQMSTKLNEICSNNDFKIPPSLSLLGGGGVLAETVVNLLKFVLKQLERVLAGVGMRSTSPLAASSSRSTAALLMDNNNFLDEDRGMTGTGALILPLEIAAEGPSIFNLPSPVGSVTSSFRYGSISDIDMGLGVMGLDGPPDAPTPFPLSPSVVRGRAPSIMLHTDEGSGVLEPPEEVKVKSPTGALLLRRGGRGGDSSEEEEAVSRNFVKRQSQILYEAKTRKGGRFNSGGPGVAASIITRTQTKGTQ